MPFSPPTASPPYAHYIVPSGIRPILQKTRIEVRRGRGGEGGREEDSLHELMNSQSGQLRNVNYHGSRQR